MSGFSFSSNLDLVKNLISIIKNIYTEDSFEKERNAQVVTILESIRINSDFWDANTKVSARNTGFSLEQAVFNWSSIDPSSEINVTTWVENIYYHLLKFSLEMYLSVNGELKYDINDYMRFSIDKNGFFSESMSNEITRLMYLFPIAILKGIVNNGEFNNLSSYIAKINDSNEDTQKKITHYNDLVEQYKNQAEEKQKDWENYISTKKDEVENIKNSLDNYAVAFNFVGLYDGFNNLSKSKKIERRLSLFTVVFLGVLVFSPLVYEIYSSYGVVVKYTSIYDILTLIPVFSITFILIYYLRVALQNHSSIKAQLSQIELRKTLCQFIQSYSDYATKMKKDDPSSLSKFEGIIFSSIITNGEDIPSTFDGLEQIVKLVAGLKKTS